MLEKFKGLQRWCSKIWPKLQDILTFAGTRSDNVILRLLCFWKSISYISTWLQTATAVSSKWTAHIVNKLNDRKILHFKYIKYIFFIHRQHIPHNTKPMLWHTHWKLANHAPKNAFIINQKDLKHSCTMSIMNKITKSWHILLLFFVLFSLCSSQSWAG